MNKIFAIVWELSNEWSLWHQRRTREFLENTKINSIQTWLFLATLARCWGEEEASDRRATLDNFKTAYATATKIAQKNHHHLGIVVHGVKGFRNMVRSEKHDPELLTQRKDPQENEKKKKKIKQLRVKEVQ